MRATQNVNHLIRRGDIYYFNRRVPKELQEVIGNSLIRKSLGTEDLDRARSQARAYIAETDAIFAEAREALTARTCDCSKVEIDEHVIRSFCELWEFDQIERDFTARMQGISPEEFKRACTFRNRQLTDLRQAVARGDTTITEAAFTGWQNALKVRFWGTEAETKALKYQFLISVTKAAEVQVQRDTGIIVPTPPSPKLPVWKRHLTEYELSFDNLFELWRQEKKNRPKGTIDDAKRSIERLGDFLGVYYLDYITRSDIYSFRDHLLHVQELESNTVDKALALISAVFKQAIQREWLEKNPAADIEVPRANKKSKRKPFSIKDIEKIFLSPIYIENERPRHLGGEAAAWIPLIMLFSGCRLEEIAQMLLSDIQQEGTIHYFYFRINSEVSKDVHSDEVREIVEKRLKNEQSERKVPIHSAIIRAGFMQYVAHMKANREIRLFPGLTRDSKGKYSGTFSKHYGTYLRTIIGIDDKNKVLYSARHSFKTAARRAGVPKDILDFLQGHPDHSTGALYGDDYPLERYQEEIEKVRYGNLEIPQIGSPLS